MKHLHRILRKSLLTVGLLALFSTNLYAGGLTMCASDWPVWETARGMAALNKLDGFSLSAEKYDTCINGFASGKYDVTFMTLYDFISTQRDDANGVVVAATDYSSGGDGVIVRADITSAQGLKGKKLAMQANTISLYVANLYLTKNGMSLNDVAISNVDGGVVSKAFAANKRLSGIVGWNPNLDGALAAGGKLVATSADFPETVFDVIVVNKDSLAKNKAALQTFVDNWFATVDTPEANQKIADVIKVSADEFSAWLTDASIYKNKADSLKTFPRMNTVAGEVQNFFNTKPTSVKGKAAGLFGAKSLDIAGLFDDSLLQ